MRILCVTPSYPPHTGGGEKYAHRTNWALTRSAIPVDVITSVPGVAPQALRMDDVNVTYVQAPRFVGFPWFNPATLLAALRRTQAPVVLAYGPSPYDPITAFLARAAGRRFVQVYHADFNDRRIETRIVTWLHNQLALRLANGIICTNEAMRRKLEKRGLGKRVAVATPGVDERFFAERIEDSDLDVLFVAALDKAHEYKRLDLLLRALAIARRGGSDVRLHVAGEGELRPQFEHLASELGLNGAVRFLGKVDDDTLTALYRRSKAFVLPSPTSQEGFGLVCLEAMASGLPTVCSVNAGAAAVVRSAPACGVWDGRTLEDLARALLAARAATRAQREDLLAFTQQFGWRSSVGRLIAELRRIGAFPGEKP